MNYLILFGIQDKTVHFCDCSGTGIILHAQADQLIRTGLIESFNLEDAKQIVTASEIPDSLLTRLTGTSFYLPVSRLQFLPFLILMFGISLAVSYPIRANGIVIGSINLSAMHIIFPLSFIFTDLINELFGYQTAKRVVLHTALIWVLMAVLLSIVLYLPIGYGIPHFTNASQSEIDSGFNAMYTGLPQQFLIHALCLLVAGTFNACFFSQMKSFLTGKQLWLRSLLSNIFSQVAYIMIFSIALQAYYTVVNPEKAGAFLLKNCFSALEFKLAYFVVAIPLIYGIRAYILNQEEKSLKAEMKLAAT